ncbi:hypothetical protein HHI36_007039 [Cryptolaemus montrouzieri]|uniref:Alanine aminotransferase 1 n=1 Tax=Cryptolaemus montrouzieri TaxID=559131 RepID=A0ABD2MNE2_9CUCU
MHQGIRNMEDYFKLPIVLRAKELEEELRTGATKPFKKIIKAHSEDCHALGQKPITFLRQVLILVTYPELMKDPRFPEDAKERARVILAGCNNGSIGSYSENSGIETIRRHCAEFIEHRDGIHSDWQNITLSPGTSGGIRNILQLLAWKLNGKDPGVMIPKPSFPLYDACLQELNMHSVPYFLNEKKNWGVDLKELNKSFDDSTSTCTLRAIIVNNPGNPTGHVFTLQNIQEIIKFAYNRSLIILADESQQGNVYDGSRFHSVKRVMIEMGPPYCDIELASFMSVSKGYIGESGVRGGYVEVVNMDPDVYQMYVKSLVCPSSLGQAAVHCLVDAPKEGEASYRGFLMEKNEILLSFKEKAKLCSEIMNSINGITCNPVQGAVYAFPRITMPAKALNAAKYENQLPDVFYTFQLLEKTGICVIPGSTFGQKPGTWYFRTTILPLEEEFGEMLKGFREFHTKFLTMYS